MLPLGMTVQSVTLSVSLPLVLLFYQESPKTLREKEVLQKYNQKLPDRKVVSMHNRQCLNAHTLSWIKN